MDFTQELLLRILIAALCGTAIGYERKNRHKEAGIRTHILVAVGAALMMIVSKYGFDDIIANKGIGLDPSRIGAQIVTGVGFLGAGVIFVRNHIVNGLTTAAGLWVTSGIGMAVGSGLYQIGIISAIGVVIVQIVLHLPLRPFRSTEIFNVEIHIKNKSSLSKLEASADENDLHIHSTEITHIEEGWKVLIKVSCSLEKDKETWLSWLLSNDDVYYLKY